MSRLHEVRRVAIPTFTDDRGSLTTLEPPRDLPFAIARIFWIHNVLPPFERGGHAHLETDHLLVCLHGRMEVEVSDGRERLSHTLDNATTGLFVPRMTWTRMYELTPDAVCLVAASAPYDPAALFRDWDVFVARAAEMSAGASPAS